MTSGVRPVIHCGPGAQCLDSGIPARRLRGYADAGHDRLPARAVRRPHQLSDEDGNPRVPPRLVATGWWRGRREGDFVDVLAPGSRGSRA